MKSVEKGIVDGPTGTGPGKGKKPSPKPKTYPNKSEKRPPGTERKNLPHDPIDDNEKVSRKDAGKGKKS